MNQVYVIEEKITDYPDFETFVGVKGTVDEAEQIVYNRLQEEIFDYGEGEIVKKVISPTQTRYEVKDGLGVMFITKHEV